MNVLFNLLIFTIQTMSSKLDKIAINNPLLDKRVKLTPEQKEIIHKNEGNHSQRELARMYNVSRRLIQFILDPEKRKQNLKTRDETGGSKQYYDKEKRRVAIAKHRAYKKELFNQGKLNTDEKP